MKIQKQDIYHGVALTQIVEHESFTAINKVNGKYGLYAVNYDKRLYVKYRSNPDSPWHFEFSVSEIERIVADASNANRVYVCLICGQETICALSYDELCDIICMHTTQTQFVRVDVRESGSLWVSGSSDKLTNSVPHNSFPEKIFA